MPVLGHSLVNIIYCVYCKSSMELPSSEPHCLVGGRSQGRRLGVIVLTDNRSCLPGEAGAQEDFRGSAFKGTARATQRRRPTRLSSRAGRTLRCSIWSCWPSWAAGWPASRSAWGRWPGPKLRKDGPGSSPPTPAGGTAGSLEIWCESMRYLCPHEVPPVRSQVRLGDCPQESR